MTTIDIDNNVFSNLILLCAICQLLTVQPRVQMYFLCHLATIEPHSGRGNLLAQLPQHWYSIVTEWEKWQKFRKQVDTQGKVDWGEWQHSDGRENNVETHAQYANIWYQEPIGTKWVLLKKAALTKAEKSKLHCNKLIQLKHPV